MRTKPKTDTETGTLTTVESRCNASTSPALNYHEPPYTWRQTTATRCLHVFVIVIFIVFIFASPHLKRRWCWEPIIRVLAMRKVRTQKTQKMKPKESSTWQLEHASTPVRYGCLSVLFFHPMFRVSTLSVAQTSPMAPIQSAFLMRQDPSKYSHMAISVKSLLWSGCVGNFGLLVT